MFFSMERVRKEKDSRGRKRGMEGVIYDYVLIYVNLCLVVELSILS